MIFLKENIRFLRKKHGMTQDKLAGLLDVKRSLIGSYEEGRGVPKLSVIKQMAEIFGVSLDELLAVELERAKPLSNQEAQDLKVLTIAVTPDNEERISIVPVKASAGYLIGRSDPEFIGNLPHFSMPVSELSRNKSYRVFQIKGDSMLPVPPGSYIFCEFVEDINDVRDGKAYILITANEGLVYKRIYVQNENELMLKSDNPDYSSYTIGIPEVFEIWRALGYLTFELPDPGVTNVNALSSAVLNLQKELQKIKAEVKKD